MSEPLPQLRHDTAVCAVLCAKNAWLAGDALRPLYVRLNEPWHIVFAYSENYRESMNMALYVGLNDDPSDSPKSLIKIDEEHIEQLYITDTHYAERFATSCVVTMEHGVHEACGESFQQATHAESRKRFPRMDPPV